jgi:N-acetylglucosamine-6-phosphate deacetylase
MSREVLFRGGPVCAADGVLSEGWVLVRDGHIVDLGSGSAPLGADGPSQIIDLEGRALAPGLIDLHAHGALGCDTMDADPASLSTMARFYAQHGVTGYLAATMTAPIEEITAALKTVAGAMATATGGARLLGAHLEGPFLDPAHAGAQAPAHVIRAEETDYAALFDTGAVRILTLAPDFPESRPLIGYARQRDVVVAMGHTGADYETACEAVRLGVSHVTHLYNAMPPLNHRQPGTVGAALTLDALTCELIVDLVHGTSRARDRRHVGDGHARRRVFPGRSAGQGRGGRGARRRWRSGGQHVDHGSSRGQHDARYGRTPPRRPADGLAHAGPHTWPAQRRHRCGTGC